jgi:hypothetical protein
VHQVAAQCLYEGLVGEGFQILPGLRARYDGPSGTLTFAPLDAARSGNTWQLPFVTPPAGP